MIKNVFLKRFLVRNNIYDTFLYEVNKRKSFLDKTKLYDYINTYEYRTDIFDITLIWSVTRDGWDFWSDIHRRYIRYIIKMNDYMQDYKQRNQFGLLHLKSSNL